MTETKIVRHRNGLTIRLPAALARDVDLREGDLVTLRRTERGVAVERRLGCRLAAMLATVREPEGEFETGPAVGNEIFE
jgi:antitoxin component of MazEF toxin-antitoxin module